MKLLREVLGYILGGLTFVVLMPVLMWFVSGMPAFVFNEMHSLGDGLLHMTLP